MTALDITGMVHQSLVADADHSHLQPDIIEFVRSPEYLDRANIYPRQATLLKLIFLQVEIMTWYDFDVIEEWEQAYIRTSNEKGEGNNGITPGIMARVWENRLCPCGHDRYFHTYHQSSTSFCMSREGEDDDLIECECESYQGRWWFREVVSVIGRRGSKGHIGALATAYILQHFIEMGDPQGHYGVDRDKRLTAIVFGAKKEQAKANQWADINNVIVGAPWFSQFISKPQTERLTVKSRRDGQKRDRLAERGVDSERDIASFEIVPKESTVAAARGPAAFLQIYDEAAHVVKGVANTPAELVYDASTPALDQFGKEGFIYLPSSPWQMIGLFYTKYLQAIEMEIPPEVLAAMELEEGQEPERWHPEARAVYPEMMMIQLTSWDTYKDWEKADTIPVYPVGDDPREEFAWNEDQKQRNPYVPLGIERNLAGPFRIDFRETEPQYHSMDPLDDDAWRHYPKFRNAIQTYDHEMQQLEKANPETFKVERRAHFAAVMDAYLNPDRIKTIWEPWQGEELYQKSQGELRMMYRGHGDPSKSGAGFGFAVAHIERPPGEEFPHVVFDRVHHWNPADYEDHQIDYREIGNDIMAYLDGFMPAELTFDQFNSVGIIQRLNRHVREKNYPKRVSVYERPATGPLNWRTYESFKTALGLGLIHAPYYEIADLELTFLQDLGGKVDCPTSGPVQTKDVADCMAIVVYELIGDEMMAFLGQEFSDFGMRASGPQGGMDPYSRQREEAHDKLSQFGRMGRPGVGGAARGRFPRR